MQIPETNTFGYAKHCINEKPRSASFVDLFLKIQMRVKPCPQISCYRDRSNVSVPYDKAVNIDFRELLFSTNQYELHFVIVKF